MLLNFVLILAAAIASLVCGVVLGRKFPSHAPLLAALGSVVLGLSVLPRLIPHLLYFLFPPYFAFEVLLACAFVLCGILGATYLDSVFRGVLQGILFLLMIYFIIVPPAYLALHGDYIRSLNYDVRDGVTIQSSYFGCVASSLATVLRTYGLEHTEGEIAYALHTTILGTDYSRIPRVVRDFGRDRDLRVGFMRTNLDGLRQLNQPGILFVFSGRIPHATALLGFDGDRVILGEPLHGRLLIPMSEFQQRTRWTGLAALVAPEVVLVNRPGR